MPRSNFPDIVFDQAWERSGGVCEVSRLEEIRELAGLPSSCNRPAQELDHIEADILGGEPTLENSAYLCVECHKIKTKYDQACRKTRNKHKVRKGRPKPGWFRQGRKIKSGSRLKGRGFDKRKTKKFNGEGVKR